MGSIAILSVMTAVQICHMVLLLGMKPYNKRTNNAIEFTNELFFMLFLLWHFYFNSQSRWNRTSISTFMTLMMCNSGVVVILLIVDLYYLAKKH